MRDFILPWGLLLGLVKCVWTELPTASRPKSARVYCGYRPGPTRVALHPGRMVEVPERQLLRAWFARVWKWLHCLCTVVDVLWCSTVRVPAPFLERCRLGAVSGVHGTVPSSISSHVTFSGSRTRIVQWPSRLVFRTTPRLNLSLLAATQTWTSLRQPLLRLWMRWSRLLCSLQGCFRRQTCSPWEPSSSSSPPRSLHNHVWRFFRHFNSTHHLRPRVSDRRVNCSVERAVPEHLGHRLRVACRWIRR